MTCTSIISNLSNNNSKNYSESKIESTYNIWYILFINITILGTAASKPKQGMTIWSRTSIYICPCVMQPFPYLFPHNTLVRVLIYHKVYNTSRYDLSATTNASDQLLRVKVHVRQPLVTFDIWIFWWVSPLLLFASAVTNSCSYDSDQKIDKYLVYVYAYKYRFSGR